MATLIPAIGSSAFDSTGEGLLYVAATRATQRLILAGNAIAVQ